MAAWPRIMAPGLVTSGALVLVAGALRTVPGRWTSRRRVATGAAALALAATFQGLVQVSLVGGCVLVGTCYPFRTVPYEGLGVLFVLYGMAMSIVALLLFAREEGGQGSVPSRGPPSEEAHGDGVSRAGALWVALGGALSLLMAASLLFMTRPVGYPPSLFFLTVFLGILVTGLGVTVASQLTPLRP